MSPKKPHSKGQNAVSLEKISNLHDLREFFIKTEKSQANLAAIKDRCEEILEKTTKNKDKGDIEDFILALESKINKIAPKKTPQKTAEQMFALVTYNESQEKTLPTNHAVCDELGAVRAHVFPQNALRKITARNKTELGQSIKEIPCLILPKRWELEVDDLIQKYAKHCSETGKESVNETVGTAAITQETEFATQHPEIYLEIFKHLLSELAKNKLDEAESNLLMESFQTAQQKIREISDKIFGQNIPGLFGIDKAQRSRTKSDSEGKDGAREVLENSDHIAKANPPSLAGFMEFEKQQTNVAPSASINASIAICATQNSKELRCSKS